MEKTKYMVAKRLQGFPMGIRTTQIPVIQVNDNNIDTRVSRLETMIDNLDLIVNRHNLPNSIQDLDTRVRNIERMLNPVTSAKRQRTGLGKKNLKKYRKKSKKHNKKLKKSKKSRKLRMGRFLHKKSRRKRR